MSGLNHGLAALARDIRELQGATGALGWDRGDEPAADGGVLTPASDPADMGKPIGKDQWTRAFLIAMAVAKSVPPYVPMPIPGADPQGYVWLTWKSKDDRRGVALEILPHRPAELPFRWTMRSPSNEKRTFAGDSLHDIVECIRTAFEGALAS